MTAAKKQRLLRILLRAIAAAADLNMTSTVLALDMALIATERATPLPARERDRCCKPPPTAPRSRAGETSP